jgi:hypothetical protein
MEEHNINYQLCFCKQCKTCWLNIPYKIEIQIFITHSQISATMNTSPNLQRSVSCPPSYANENDVPVLLALRKYISDRVNGLRNGNHTLFERIYRRSTPDNQSCDVSSN